MSTADNSTKKSPVSVRERARQETTRRLAAEHARLRENENDLVTFFDAGKTTEKIGADLEKKIHVNRDDAAIKISAAELKQATALRTIKERDETVASIAGATDPSAAEVRKLLKRAPAGAPGTVSTPTDEPTTAKLVPPAGSLRTAQAHLSHATRRRSGLRRLHPRRSHVPQQDPAADARLGTEPNPLTGPAPLGGSGAA
jgi:hypothetical protein